MRSRLRRPSLVHGLATLLVLAAAPLLAQTVEVTTLPGDAPGDKVAFQFSESEVVTAGANASVEIPIPDGAAMTIETVTARGFAPLNILPEVNLSRSWGRARRSTSSRSSARGPTWPSEA